MIRYVLLLVWLVLGACRFDERGFRDLVCESDSDCTRPDQECRSALCTQRACSEGTACPTGHEFTCTSEGLCVAAECTDSAECADGFACNAGFCQASFNVAAVAATSHTSVSVTFDSPPDAATASDPANYTIDGLAIIGTPTLSGSTVVLATSAQAAAEYHVAVANVVRDSDQAPLLGGTAAFTGRGPFAVASAMATSSVTVAVTFSEPPVGAEALNAASYSIDGGLGVSASPPPTLSGNVVTLTTGTQVAGSYTVHVANVHRAADGEPLTSTSAVFAGRTDFNIASVASRSNTQIAVTFDAEPNAAQAVTLASYSIPGLTLTGTPLVAGTTVTLTTSPQQAQSYTLAVTGVTRASDSEPLTVASMDVTGRAAFNVAGAQARTSRQLAVTFDAPPDPSDAVDLGNYAVGGLALTGTPTLTGNVVTIETSTQAVMPYTLTVTGVRRADDLEPLAADTTVFTGRAPFNVTTAHATSSTSLTVTFSDPPNSGQASLPGNYGLDGDVTVLSAAQAGTTVTLTTTPMTATTYTLGVAGITRASDGEELTTASAMFTGRAPFNVVSATAPTSGTIAVAFDAPPNAAAATNLANYSVPGLVLSGTPVLSGSTVTLETGAQLAETYVVTVSGVTRASDGEPLSATTGAFTGRPRFNVASASSGSNVTVRITFDAPPDPAEAITLASYSVDNGLTLTGTPTLQGNVVTLMTSNQVGGASYVVTVNGVSRASDGEPLTKDNAGFTGLTGFNVTGASSVNTTNVAVTFDAPPAAGPAQTAANYTITGNGGLTVQSAVLSGNTVTLTTSGQTDGTYTVTVASAVTRANDGSPLVVTSTQFRYVSFNVTGAATVTNRSATVTFDAPPNPTQATIQSNYVVSCSPAPCASLTVSSPVLAGNTVTLTTTSQQLGTTYTVTVNNVTRASDGSTLAVKTGAFIGRSAFNLVSAMAPTSGTLALTFDAAPSAAQATQLASYSVPGLALSGTPVLAGNTVTLNTSVQSAQSYTVTVANVSRASDGEPLATNMATFAGKAQSNPTVTNVVVQSTVPDNGATFYNTGTATVVITGTEFNGVSCLTGVRLDDLDGAGNLLGTRPTSCTVDSATQITAQFPAGIRSSYTGWNIQVTNSVGTNATSVVKLVVRAGLLVSEIYVGSAGGANDTREYIELYNPTANPLNLDTLGLQFHVRDASGNDVVLAPSFNGSGCAMGVCTRDIPAQKFWLLSSSVSTSDSWYAHRNAVYTPTATAELVPNGGVYISLSTTQQSRVIDKAGWGSQPAPGREGTAIASFGNEGKSAQRKPGTTTASTDTDANSSDFNTPSSAISPRGTRD